MKSNERRSTKIIINSFGDLIRVAESNVLTPQQFKLVMQSCKPFVGIFLEDYNDTMEMAKVLIEVNKKWKHNH